MARILVAEDERDIRELITFSLEMLGGHQVLPADNGEQALALAREDVPDLILLDMRMPRLSGLEVCRQLKADPQTRPIPVVFLSAKGLDEEIQAGMDAGAVAFMVKPFDITDLVMRVANLLEPVQS
jgi:CheY-like chemotaxis protein